MRPRHAALVLLPSMVFLGVSLAIAQTPTQERGQAPGIGGTKARIPTKSLLPVTLRKAGQAGQVGQALRQSPAAGGGAQPTRPPPPASPTRPIAPPSPPPVGPAAPGAPAGGSGSLTPFETGIEDRPASPRQRILFNLEDADLPDLVRLIASITGKRFIISGKGTKSIKASVFAPTEVTAAEAYQAFLSILEVNGLTLVPSGRYLKITDVQNISQQPVSTYTRGQATPSDDRYITRMYRLGHVSAEDIAQVLGRFRSPSGDITVYAPTNTLIITDTGTQIRRMLRMVEELDVASSGEQVWVEPVHYASATDLAARLLEIFQAGQQAGAAAAGQARPAPSAQPAAGVAGTTTVGRRAAGDIRVSRILADERTNQLIIQATERGYLRVLELLRALDVPLPEGGQIHVHYLQHADATELSGTLSSVISGAPAGRAGAGGAVAAAPAGGGGGSIFEGQVRVTADKATNSLVITSSLRDYATLRRVIERLDMRRRQVFIEAVIMELSVTRDTAFGLGLHGGAQGVVADDDLLLAGLNAGGSLLLSESLLSGLAIGIRGAEIPGSEDLGLIGTSLPSFGIFLQALSKSGDSDILSTPHIIAMDNEEAEISVGENVPLQSSVSLPGGLGAAAGAAAAGGQLGGLAGLLGGLGAGIQRQDVGIKLNITPHINESQEVRLEILQEISEVGETAGNLGFRINKRTAKTKVSVRDQQTVVIGGLVRDVLINSEDRVPVLGDLPLLGVLFRRTTRQMQKRNLLLFLTPYIIRDASDLRRIFEERMRERQEFIDRYFVFGEQDWEPRIDYSRTNGVVSEIVIELRRLDEEAALEREALARPPPEHVPRPPVGGVGPGDLVVEPEGVVSATGPPGGGSIDVVITPPSPNPTSPSEPTPPQ
ncbi:MAG: type II secretion system secretin GspD [Deltaproteobacteria bacterium]|nr:type II secretion system secretin GspD [Deltaproteobacteria bacterium]